MFSIVGSLVQRTGDKTTGNYTWTVAVHDCAGSDAVSGLEAVKREEELQREIEHQLLLGGTGLDKRDIYMQEINIGDLETSSGEDQYNWLLAT